jgi:hypothetical protein
MSTNHEPEPIGAEALERALSLPTTTTDWATRPTR